MNVHTYMYNTSYNTYIQRGTFEEEGDETRFLL